MCSFRQVIAYEQGQVVESLTEYLGRVKFAFRPTQDAGIFINHTRVSDTGTYQCTVINPPDGATPNIGLVGLTVLGKSENGAALCVMARCGPHFVEHPPQTVT